MIIASCFALRQLVKWNLGVKITIVAFCKSRKILVDAGHVSIATSRKTEVENAYNTCVAFCKSGKILVVAETCFVQRHEKEAGTRARNAFPFHDPLKSASFDRSRGSIRPRDIYGMSEERISLTDSRCPGHVTRNFRVFPPQFLQEFLRELFLTVKSKTVRNVAGSFRMF